MNKLSYPMFLPKGYREKYIGLIQAAVAKDLKERDAIRLATEIVLRISQKDMEHEMDILKILDIFYMDDEDLRDKSPEERQEYLVKLEDSYLSRSPSDWIEIDPEHRWWIDGLAKEERRERFKLALETLAQDFKTEGGVRFRRSDYAVRGEEGKPTTWKLPLVEGKSGNFTVAKIVDAITAMQPSGFRGQRVQLKPGEKEEAIRNIRAAIAKVGTDEQKEHLRKRLASLGLQDCLVELGLAEKIEELFALLDLTSPNKFVNLDNNRPNNYTETVQPSVVRARREVTLKIGE